MIRFLAKVCVLASTVAPAMAGTLVSSDFQVAKNERMTIFGVPYIQEAAGAVKSPLASLNPNKGPRITPPAPAQTAPASGPSASAATPTNTATPGPVGPAGTGKPADSFIVASTNQPVIQTPKRRLDYGNALRLAPIDMITPEGLIVGGNLLHVGDGFAMDLPVSRFTNAASTVKQVVSARPGQADATRIVANPEDMIIIHATFILTSIAGDVLTFRVIPDKDTAPLQSALTYQLSNDLGAIFD